MSAEPPDELIERMRAASLYDRPGAVGNIHAARIAQSYADEQLSEARTEIERLKAGANELSDLLFYLYCHPEEAKASIMQFWQRNAVDDDDPPAIEVTFLTAADVEMVRRVTSTPCSCERCNAKRAALSHSPEGTDEALEATVE